MPDIATAPHEAAAPQKMPAAEPISSPDILNFDIKLMNQHDPSDKKEYTPAEIVEKCSGIAAMAVKDQLATFQDAALAQRMAERGRAKRLAKEKEQTSVKAGKIESRIAEKEKTSAKDNISLESKTIENKPHEVVLATALVVDREVSVQNLESIKSVVTEAEHARSSNAEVLKDPIPIDIKANVQKNEPVVQLSPSPRAQEIINEEVTATSIDLLKNMESPREMLTKMPDQEEIALTELPTFKEHVAEPALGVYETADLAALPKADKAQIYYGEVPEATEYEQVTLEPQRIVPEAIDNEGEEALGSDSLEFDVEVIDTFQELLDIIQSVPTTDSDMAGENEQIIIISKDGSETDPLAATVLENPFEIFLADMPQNDEPLETESVITAADGQELEVTLTQLSQILSETRPEPNQPREQIVEILNEILPIIESADEKVVLTPVLTARLLELLRAAGYTNPGEALVRFVTRHDFEFLIQAIRYLALLTSDDNRQEFLASRPAHTLAKGIQPVNNRVGRIIFSLITSGMFGSGVYAVENS